MKIRNTLTAVVMTVVFLCSNIAVNADYSEKYAEDDYREQIVWNIYGEKITKPIANFRIIRMRDGEVIDMLESCYDDDLDIEFPTMQCYVGDTIAFEDLSEPADGTAINAWDFQYYGALGDSYREYDYNILESIEFELTQEGETAFFLCVKSNADVQNGSLDPWSDNGNHQAIGINKWFPNGMYWYFASVKIVVNSTEQLPTSDSDNDNNDDDGNIVKPSGICDGVIEWTENASHRVVTGYNSNGSAIYKTCRHTFTYQSVLSADATVTPSILKSGYGFETEVNYSIKTKQIDNYGSYCSSWGNNRSPKKMVKDPTKATVYIPWSMTNRLGTQEKEICMEKSGNTFQLPQSVVSEIGARKIYTDVSLAGTNEEPVNHSFEIYISGGGVGSVEFCKKLTKTITVNGDMYQDDFSGAD